MLLTFKTNYNAIIRIEKNLLQTGSVNFILPGGSYIPRHFHLTEIGLIDKHFIDCGGKGRSEKKISLQLLHANDTDHRLSPAKFLKIIESAETVLNADDHEVEAEYQNETIGRYALDFDGTDFLLRSTHTACLAEDSCGIPDQSAQQLPQNKEVCCTPGGGCC